MKSKVIFLMVLITSAVSLAFAGSPNKKSIRISEPVVIDGVALPPGDYRVQWTGNGPNVIATFSQGNETYASVPATLEMVNSPYDGAVAVQPKPSGAGVLLAINWSKLTLSFHRPDELSARK